MGVHGAARGFAHKRLHAWVCTRMCEHGFACTAVHRWVCTRAQVHVGCVCAPPPNPPPTHPLFPSCRLLLTPKFKKAMCDISPLQEKATSCTIMASPARCWELQVTAAPTFRPSLRCGVGGSWAVPTPPLPAPWSLWGSAKGLGAAKAHACTQTRTPVQMHAHVYTHKRTPPGMHWGQKEPIKNYNLFLLPMPPSPSPPF